MKMNKVIGMILAILMFFEVGFALDYNTIAYSEVYFPGDSSHATTIGTYFTNHGYIINKIERPTTAYVVNVHLKNDKTFYISTHGSSLGNLIQLSNTVWFGISSLTNDPVRAKFVFYSACYSSKTDSSGNNLCLKTVTKGAKAAAGYFNDVTVPSSRYFESKFYNYFAQQSYSVSYSKSNAAALTYNVYGSEPDCAAQCNSIYGNGSYTLS